MSNIHPFSQAGFWDFVAGLKARNNVEGGKRTPANRAMDRPRGPRNGLGRRARNAVEADDMPAPPLTELDPIPYRPLPNEDEKTLPHDYPVPQHQTAAAALASEDEKMAADVMPPRAGRNRGPGPRGRFLAQGLGGEGPRGRRMRMALFEEGSFPSEEEFAAVDELRRLRRLRLQTDADGEKTEEEMAAMKKVRRLRRLRRQGQLNGDGTENANPEGPRARRMRRRLLEQNMTTETGNDDNNNTNNNNMNRGMGPCARRNRNNGEAFGPRQMKLRPAYPVNGPSDENVAPVGPRGPGPRRGGCGMKQARQLRDLPRDGPAQVGPMANQGANPSNGEDKPNVPRKFGPRARKMAALRQQAQLNGDGDGYQQIGEPVAAGNVTELPLRPRMGRPAMRLALRQQKMNRARNVPDTENETPGADLNANIGPAGKRMNKKGYKARADVFETPGSYFVQLPVPGATQKDVGIMWDSDKDVLRVAGMVQRPNPGQIADGATLVRAQRNVGRFQRFFRFGKKHEKVRVYENGITAKLEDGVLTIEVPKYDGEVMTSDGEYVEVKPAY